MNVPNLDELMQVVGDGDYKRLRELLANGADPNECLQDGMSLPRFAMEYYEDWNASRCFEALIKAGADMSWRDSEGHSYLYLALDKDNMRIAEFLLQSGADPNDVVAESAKDLLDHFSREVQVELLLKYGAKFDRPPDANGRTRLHAEDAPWNAYLSNRLGLDLLRVQDINGDTPLHFLARRYHHMQWQRLKTHELDPDIQNNEGQTILHVLIQNSQFRTVLEMMNDNEYNFTQFPNFSIRDVHGHSFIDYIYWASELHLRKVVPQVEGTSHVRSLRNEPLSDQEAEDLFALCQIMGIGTAEPKETINQPQPPTIDERRKFMRSSLIKKLAAHGRAAVSLAVDTADERSHDRISTVGGIPFMEQYFNPPCPSCGGETSFFMQLFKGEHEELYYPEGTDLFCVFRCMNGGCLANEYGDLEQTISWVYAKVPEDPAHLAALLEDRAKERFYVFAASEIDDHRDIRDLRGIVKVSDEDAEEFDKKFGMMLNDAFNNCFGPLDGMKIGGFAAWVQSPEEPTICACGKEKELLLQLASHFLPSAALFNFGDAGTIWLIYCTGCGVDTIEALYQCY